MLEILLLKNHSLSLRLRLTQTEGIFLPPVSLNTDLEEVEVFPELVKTFQNAVSFVTFKVI